MASFRSRPTSRVSDSNKTIAYRMDDGREATVQFAERSGSSFLTVTFDAEDQNPVEMQRGGWQAILDNFGRRFEAKKR